MGLGFQPEGLSDKTGIHRNLPRGIGKVLYRRARPRWVGDWVNRSIKWTSELEAHWLMDTRYRLRRDHIENALFRPFTFKYCYYAPKVIQPVQNAANISARPERTRPCFCVNRKQFAASDRVVDLHLTAIPPTPLPPRKTASGSAISRNGVCDSSGSTTGMTTSPPRMFSPYAALHDPIYRETYAVDLRQEFPRLPFHEDFREFVRMGQKLLDLHIGFDSVEPWWWTN